MTTILIATRSVLITGMIALSAAFTPSNSNAAIAPTTTMVSHITTTTQPPLVAPEIMVKWNKVAWCESHGNWTQVHPGSHSFSGGIGMRNDVWVEYGGRQFAEYSGQATPEQQVFIARRVQARAGIVEYVPDQTGCNGSW
jgi:hypothetical protein